MPYTNLFVVNGNPQNLLYGGWILYKMKELNLC